MRENITANEITIVGLKPERQLLHEWIEKIEKQLAEITNQSKDNKREKMRLLLEGENGFFRKYNKEIQYGSIHGLGKVINKSMDEIFDLFKENL